MQRLANNLETEKLQNKTHEKISECAVHLYMYMVDLKVICLNHFMFKHVTLMLC